MVLRRDKLWLVIICTAICLLSACQWPLFSPESSSTPVAISEQPIINTPGGIDSGYPGIENEATLSAPAGIYPGSTLESQDAATATSFLTTYPELPDPIEQPASVYPGMEATPTISLYPANPPATSGSVYPGNDPQSPSTSQTPGSPPPVNSAYPGNDPQSPSVTQTPGSTSPTSSPTPANVSQTQTPTPSVTSQIATGTLSSPSSTPTQQPTLTATATMTPVPTTIPPPPWIQSQLVATNPEEVVLASGKIQLVEFFAFWCGPCQAMAPLVHGLEDRYESRMNFIFLDIDNPRTADLKELLGYKSQPHFFLLDEYGRIIKQWVGVIPIDELTQAIEASLK